MAIPIDRDAVRRLMEAAARVPSEELYWGTKAERRRYKAMTPAQKEKYWHQPLAPEHQAVVDNLREKLLDSMPNLTPKK